GLPLHVARGGESFAKCTGRGGGEPARLFKPATCCPRRSPGPRFRPHTQLFPRLRSVGPDWAECIFSRLICPASVLRRLGTQPERCDRVSPPGEALGRLAPPGPAALTPSRRAAVPKRSARSWPAPWTGWPGNWGWRSGAMPESLPVGKQSIDALLEEQSRCW